MLFGVGMEEKKFLQHYIPIGMAVFRHTDTWELVEMNKAFCELFGFTESVLVNRFSHRELVYRRDFPAYEEIFSDMEARREDAVHEFRIVRGDHLPHWVQSRTSFLEERDGAEYHLWILQDVHTQKTTEMELKLLNEQYKVMEEVTQEIPFDLDVLEWRVFDSERMQQMRGEEDTQPRFIAMTEFVKQIHPMDREDFVNRMKSACAKNESGYIDYRLNISKKHVAQQYAWFRTNYRCVVGVDEKVTRIIGRTCNIDRNKTLQEEIKRDPLTNLLNKIETKNEIIRSIERNPHMTGALLLIDIDNFKSINDTFGHTFGDMVISDVAAQLREQFRREDIVGRIGGDEFLVMMKGAPEKRVIEKAGQLCSVFSKEYNGQGVTKNISISIGVAFIGKDGVSYEELVEKADHAMYRAKKSGKSGFQVAQHTDTGPIRIAEKAIETRSVISQDDQAFMTFAVGLMSHARNIDGSMNLLLQRMAQRFRVDMVAVFEFEADSTVQMTNYYSQVFDCYDQMVFPSVHPKIMEAAVGEIVVVRDVCIADFENLQQLFKYYKGRKKVENCTLVAGKYEYTNGKQGSVYFMVLDENWTLEDNERALFQELIRMLSIFVSLRFHMNESKAEIRQLQKKDQLTGLYNFDAFKETAKSVLRNKKSGKIYAVEYLDINNFGYVNDNYGYQVGDNALKAFATDTMAQPYYEAGCRLYSDFFVMLISDESRESLEVKLNEQHQRFTNRQNHRYPNSSMGISSGVYIIEEDSDDVDYAVENANLAWKKTKQLRRQSVLFFEEELRKSRTDEQQVIGEFYEALYRDDFVIFLQPKFILGTQEVYGAESLARWRKPNGSIVSPGIFVNPLEKIGYITELDFYMYEKLLKMMSGWQKKNYPRMIISTNFSGRHFETDGSDFLTRIFNITAKYDVDPSCIEIEITEGVMVENLSVLIRCFEKLHEKGFRTAIDDFGTGYSSLAVLTDIPADVVKMDKSFIDKGFTGERRKLILGIGKLVEIAGKEIIFEGIETEEQAKFLAENGFKHGQGYLCNRPIKVEEFENLYLKLRML